MRQIKKPVITSYSIHYTKLYEIGMITKKWAGIAKEMFTTADKYNVQLTSTNLTREHKIAILASAITIDMVLKESK